MLLNQDKSRVLMLRGLDASLENVVGAQLGAFRILHFASHGLVDSENPQLTAIALSAVDRNNNRIPGFLQLADIYDMRLNAEVVVLSACETALGSYIRGEGLVGLVHAFTSAGARSTIATTWPVGDRPTSELMGVFYSNMLQQQMPVIESLRHAQMTLLKKRRWSDPYFWAPFVFQGDWE